MLVRESNNYYTPFLDETKKALYHFLCTIYIIHTRKYFFKTKRSLAQSQRFNLGIYTWIFLPHYTHIKVHGLRSPQGRSCVLLDFLYFVCKVTCVEIFILTNIMYRFAFLFSQKYCGILEIDQRVGVSVFIFWKYMETWNKV